MTVARICNNCVGCFIAIIVLQNIAADAAVRARAELKWRIDEVYSFEGSRSHFVFIVARLQLFDFFLFVCESVHVPTYFFHFARLLVNKQVVIACRLVTDENHRR